MVSLCRRFHHIPRAELALHSAEPCICSSSCERGQLHHHRHSFITWFSLEVKELYSCYHWSTEFRLLVLVIVVYCLGNHTVVLSQTYSVNNNSHYIEKLSVIVLVWRS